MTEQEIEQYFIYHNDNIKLLKIGFDNIRNQMKTLYKSKNKDGNYIYSLSDTDQEKIKARKIEKALSRILFGIQVSFGRREYKKTFIRKITFHRQATKVLT